MKTKIEITRDWLPRYTGTEISEFGEYILLTNFSNYLSKFAKRFDCEIKGKGGPMQTSTNSNGLSIINFGIGSANAATIMDLLTACNPKGVLFLGKCGGLKQSAEIGRISSLLRQFAEKERAMIICRRKYLLYLHLSCTNLSLIPSWNMGRNIAQELFTPQIVVSGNGTINSGRD